MIGKPQHIEEPNVRIEELEKQLAATREVLRPFVETFGTLKVGEVAQFVVTPIIAGHIELAATILKGR